MLTSLCNIRVRYVETDAMGFCYHANYFAWFEVARIQLLDELGLPYVELEREGFRLPVLEAHAQYLKPAKFDDRITVTTRMPEKPFVRLRLEYEVHRGEELLAKGYTAHAFINAQGQPVKPPRSLIERMHAAFHAGAKATATV